MNKRSLAGRATLELLVIFLGVMSAFFVENWRTNREERTQERQYLDRLAADLRSDSATIDGSWSRALAVKLEAVRTIGPYVRGATGELEDTLAFARSVAAAGAGGFTAWAFQTPTMADLSATGNLRLIRDGALRGALVEHYRLLDMQTERVTGRLPLYPMAVHAIAPAEMRDSVTMELLREWGLDRFLARVRTEEFQDVLNQEFNSAVFQMAVLPGLRESTGRLLLAVDEARRRLGSD